jgi:predicted DNA-binding ribbon-helix-helix protein
VSTVSTEPTQKLESRNQANEKLMKSPIIKRSIVIGGHKTSVSLEDRFWNYLKEIAHTRQLTLSKLVAEIDQTRQYANLSSAIRVFVLEYFCKKEK